MLPQSTKEIRFVRVLLVIGALLLAPTVAQAQLYDEDFESYTNGTTVPGGNAWTADASGATPDIASVQAPSADKVFQVQDADGDVVWETASIDISGSRSAAFQLVLDQAGDMENSDYVDVAYSVDGGGFTTITDYNGLGDSQHTLAGNWSETSVELAGIQGSSLAIRVTFNNSAGSEDFFLDDVRAFGNTRVRFATGEATVQEGNSGTTTVKVDVEILNPSSNSSTSVDIAAVSGSATEGVDYTFSAQTLTFGAARSSPKTVSLDVKGDTDAEGDETVDLSLSNARGGNSAAVGTPGQYILTLKGDDGGGVQDGDVLITEIMYDPSVSESDGEWVEVYNASDVPVDLKGWTLEEDPLGNGNGAHVIGTSVPVSPGEYIILCNSTDQGANGGVSCDHEWSGPTLNNTGETIGLLRPDDTVVDKVNYDGGSPWPDASNASMVFTGTASANNNDPSNWREAASKEPTTGLTDPGSPGLRGSDQTLAVRRPMDAVGGWRFVSPPKAGLEVQYLADQGFVQGVSGSNPSATDNVYLRYSPPAGSENSSSKQHWEAADAVSNSLERGRGVLWYLWKDEVPDFLTSTGPIGGIDRDHTLQLGDHKWHLLGNPFPNAFRIGDLTASSTFARTAQVWVPSQQTFQNVGPNQPTKAVGAQVGFFLERTAGVGGGNPASVTFPAGGQALDNENVARKRAEQSGRVSLTLIGTNAAGDTTTVDRAATFVLDDQAETGRDRYDATKLTPFSGTYATLSFAPPAGKTDTLRRSVAAYPVPTDGREQVPLDVVTGGDPDVETLTIEWPSLSLPSGWTGLLKDTAADREINMRRASHYSFVPSESRTAATVATVAGGASAKTGARSASTRPVPPVPVALSRAVSEAASKRKGTASTEERFVLVLKGPSALPVELSTFSAVVDGRNARLSWRTASETNNSGFYVEHKADPSADGFRRLGFVEGAGTTQSTQSYSYRVDDLAPGKHVFRLRQVDTDGTETVTETTSVRLDTEAPLTLSAPSPNPARTRTTVTITSQNKTPVTVALFDALGRRVRTIHDGPLPGTKSKAIPLRTDDLASGLYLMRATDGTRTVTQKLTVVQ